MHVALLFPNEYLCAADLKGKEVTLTIDRLVIEKLRTRSGVENKPVLYFRETEARFKAGKSKFNKRLVLNKTNARAIKKATGERETDNWPGKRITLYVEILEEAFGEKDVDCIRVRETAPR